jgi:glycosyltransferase 2 family protein
MQSMRKNLGTGVAILVSAVFIYLAFREVDFGRMLQSFGSVNYWYLVPTFFILFASHYLRALRWRYFLDPIVRLDTGSLFTALMVGYAANVVMPAHLGEIVRAQVLSRKRPISMACAFATIVIERIIDLFSLLILLALFMMIHPFPQWVVTSGYVMLGIAVFLFSALIVCRRYEQETLNALRFILKPMPQRFSDWVSLRVMLFLDGIVPLKRWMDYPLTGVLSVAIWSCYGLTFHFCLYAFNFVEVYNLDWYVALVLLVITTISVVVPSSPGYLGTFHYLCQLSLGLFGVPASPALSYATVVHAVCFLPVFFAGLALANYEHMSVRAPKASLQPGLSRYAK